MNNNDKISIIKNLVILFVEDEIYLHKMFEQTMDKLGAKCLFASNGEEGLEILKKNNVDFIITDINMPIMNGIEFLKTIRSKDNIVKIIVCTGNNEFEYSKLSLSLGADGFLTKPVNFYNIINKIYNIITKY